MGKKKRILIVDDSLFVCVSMKDTLSSANYSVKYARSGEDAMDLLKNRMYDLIYVDMIMPGMNGIKTCELIKEIYPDAKLIFMTGCYDDVQKRHESFVSVGGEDYCLYKPFTRDEVLLSAATFLRD